MGITPPQRVHWWHESVIDWLVLNPDKNLKDCARHFKKTPAWIYTLVNSDVFKAELAKRRQEYRSVLDMGLQEKLEALSAQAIETIEERLTQAGPLLPTKDLVSVANLALTKAGYGTSSSAPSTVVNNQVVHLQIPPEKLEAARQRIKAKQLEQQAAGQSVEVKDEEPTPEVEGAACTQSPGPFLDLSAES